MTTRVVDIIREPGVHASRPAVGDVPYGALYPCTDHGLIYRSDGTTWETWATLLVDHAASHEDGGSDEIEIAQAQVTGLSAALTAKIDKTTLDANSILKADTDDTPEALAVAASRIVGRAASGDIAALTAAEVKTLLGLVVADLADFAEGVDDRVNALIIGGTGITVTYNDGANTLTIDADGGGGSVPTGGTAGQVLTKVDGTDFNTDWEDPAGGSSILDVAYVNPNSPHAGDDEFNDDTLDASTVLTTGGSCTWTEQGDVLSAKFSGQGGGQLAVRLKNIEISVGGYIQCAVRQFGVGNGSYNMAGLVFTDGVLSGSNVAGAFSTFAGTGTPSFYPTLVGTIGSCGGGSAASAPMIGPVVHLRLTWVSANTFRTEFSPDGVSWMTFGFSDVAKTMTPTKMGVHVTSWGSGAIERIASFEYFRCSG